MFPRFEVLEVLRHLASFRARFAPLLLLLPAVLVVSFDAGRRLGRLTTLSGTDRLRYALATVESMVLWGTLLVLAARRRGALRWLGSALFVLLGPLAVGTERYFYQQYDTYLNVDAAVFGASFPRASRGRSWSTRRGWRRRSSFRSSPSWAS